MTFLDRLLGRGGGNVLEQQELTKRAIRLLADGLSPAETENDLIRTGTPPRVAHRTVKLVLEVRDKGVHLFDPPSQSEKS